MLRSSEDKEICQIMKEKLNHMSQFLWAMTEMNIDINAVTVIGGGA